MPFCNISLMDREERSKCAIVLSYSIDLFSVILVLVIRAGYGSESEGDDEAATVNLATDLGRLNKASTKSAVKLQEIGPRMTLQLVKIEEGLCSGGVIFSEFGMHFFFYSYLFHLASID